jgi:uncharacterized protein
MGVAPPEETSTVPPKGLKHSCLYECSVMHHRLTPKESRFNYRIFFFCLDLDELNQADRQLFGFSHNRFNFYTFRDSDHLALTPGTLKENVIAYLAKNDLAFPANGRVMLVTLPRVLGYIFNPVSFYFCFTADGTAFCAVAQVGNTFGEMKPYLLRQPVEPNFFRLVTPKHFYVSPFSELDLQFDFKLRVPAQCLDIHIDDRDGDRRVLLSSVAGQRVALTNGRLAWLTFKYPLITLRVIFLIHFHALLLWARRLPFHRKSANAHLQRDVLKPHSSISGNPL